MKAMRTFGLAICGISFTGAAWAADGIDVKSGPDAVLFGSCVPELTVENRSNETVDYLQVALALTLRNGQERTVELESAYREGVLYPIAPGANAILKQHLDTSPSLGVACTEVMTRRMVRAICESSGKDCAALVVVQP